MILKGDIYKNNDLLTLRQYIELLNPNILQSLKIVTNFLSNIFCFLRHITTLLYCMQSVRTKTQNIISRSFCDYLYIIACKSQKSSMKVIPCRDWFVECNKSIFLKTFNKTSFVLKYFAFDTPKTFKNL